MFPQFVCSQSVARIECFVTLGTLEWLGATVDPHVSPQRGLLAEGFTTGVAHERLLPRVSPDVVLELEHFLEIFPTEGADSLRPGELEMRLPVSGQLGLRLEGLTAD